MSLLDRVRALQKHDLTHFRPFLVGGARVGWIAHGFVERLRAFGSVFEVADGAVRLSDRFGDFAARSAAMDEVVQRLEQEKLISRRRHEDYAVKTRFAAAPLLKIDRSAIVRFGVRSYGVHLNGFLPGATPDSLRLWLGRRARDKAVAPGKLDHLVAGGLPIGLSPWEDLLKECAEEADLPPSLVEHARSVGMLAYRLETEEGLKEDVLFLYDLAVPEEFRPHNTDGEIEEFLLWPIEKVRRRIAETDDFKFNVGPVIVDFMVRHGLLTADDPDYLEIIAALRAPAMFEA